MRWSPRCTYLRILALDGNTLAGGSLTFLWLSARPRVRVFGRTLCPAPYGSGSRERRVRREDGSGRGAAPFPAAGGSRGPRSVALARGVVGGSRGVSVRA